MGSRGTDGKHKTPSDGRFRVFVKGVELVLPNPDDLIIDNNDPHQVVVTWGEDNYTTAVQDSDRRAAKRETNSPRPSFQRKLVRLECRIRVYIRRTEMGYGEIGGGGSVYLENGA